MIEISLLVAVFVAGIAMFFAPCTLPLLPAYLGFISGVTEKELADPQTALRARVLIFKNSLSFVVGFAFIFIAFGLLAGIVGTFVGPLKQFLGILGGLLIILFGLFMMGLLKVPWLARERRIALPAWLTIGTPSSSFLLGSAFAFGWTPCIGPILATVLFFAGSTETIMTGAVLLFVFSLGFGLPFLGLALLIGQASRIIKFTSPYLHLVSVVGGVFLLFLGVFLVVGDFSLINSWIFNLLEALDYEEALMRYL